MNTQIINEIRDALTLTTDERYPNVIPTIEVNPKLVQNIKTESGILINATSQTIVSADPNKDIYIVGWSLGFIKDATSTSTSITISYTNEDNRISYLTRVATLTLTAQTGSDSQFLNKPIKVARNTPIAVTSSTNVGNVSAGCVIYYYKDDYSNA